MTAMLIGWVSCGQVEETARMECVSDLDHFEQTLLIPILEPQCAACHSETGPTAQSRFLMTEASDANHAKTNYEVVRRLSQVHLEGWPLLLLKPTGIIPHAGGRQLEAGGLEYQALQSVLSRLRAPSDCATVPVHTRLVASLAESTRTTNALKRTIRLAKLRLVGQVPGRAEYDQVEAADAPVIEMLVMDYLAQPAFYDTLKTWTNGLPLTNQYLRSDRALDLVDVERFPNL